MGEKVKSTSPGTPRTASSSESKGKPEDNLCGSRQLLHYCTEETPKIFRGFLLILYAVYIGGLSLLVLSTGPIINMRFGHDVPVALDGGWRVFNGQVPHVDFHAVMGPLFHILIALGMIAGGVSMQSLVALNVMMFVLFSVWALLISWRRLPPLFAVLVSVGTGLFPAGIYHLGFDSTVSTYANLYNRYCYAMLFIIAIEQFYRFKKLTDRDELVGGASTGFLLVGLFFLKFTFIFAAIAFILLRICFLQYSRTWLKGFLAGSALLLTPLLIYLKFDVAAAFNDYSVIIKTMGSGVSERSVILDKGKPVILYMVAFLTMFLVVPNRIVEIGRYRLTKMKMILVAVATISCAIFLNISNYGRLDIPLLAVSSFLPMLFCLAVRNTDEVHHKWRVATILILLVVVDFNLYYKNYRSIIYAISYKNLHLGEIARVDSESLANFYVKYADGYGNEHYVSDINDGLKLLRKNGSDTDRIVTLNFENPFPFALKHGNARGTSLTWHYPFTFTDEIFFDPNEVFGDATKVMIPKKYDPEATTPLIRVYGDYLRRYYYVQDESKSWVLLARIAPDTRK